MIQSDTIPHQSRHIFFTRDMLWAGLVGCEPRGHAYYIQGLEHTLFCALKIMNSLYVILIQ